MRVDHIAIYVRDLERARVFFTKYFGAVSNKIYRNQTTQFSSYFLSFDNGCRIEIMSRPEVHDAPFDCYRAGLTHLAFSTGSKEAVDSLTRILTTDGYQLMSGPRTTGDGYYESCLKVIENLIIEITE